MSAIWKYELRAEEHFAHLMPKGAEILSVQVQRGVPQMWARVDPTAEKERRHFGVYGTGHRVPDESEGVGLRFVGTFQLHDGDLVFHLFEALPRQGDGTGGST